jgi:hypothetical protein
MTELRLDTWRLPAAEVGAENPLPPLDRPRYQPFLSGKSEDDPEAGYVPDYLPIRCRTATPASASRAI